MDEEREAFKATIVDFVEAHNGIVTEFRSVDTQLDPRADDTYKIVIRLRGKPPVNLL